VEFEEVDNELGLVFGYRWSTSERFGFIRSARLRRDRRSPVRSAEVLDGFLNVMPPGVPLSSQQTSSTLVDAYKRSELDLPTGMGFFTLEAQISDRAEAAESLRTNVVWSPEFDRSVVLLDAGHVGRFMETGTAEIEHVTVGRRGAYLMTFDLDFEDEGRTRWDLIADVGLGHGQAQQLRALVLDRSGPGPPSKPTSRQGRRTSAPTSPAQMGFSTLPTKWPHPTTRSTFSSTSCEAASSPTTIPYR
jgi:hypothetical protein